MREQIASWQGYTNMKLRPIQDQVLVKQDTKKEMLGGLYLPQNSRELYDDYGTVVSVGSKVTEVKEGERVLFKRRANSEIPGMKDYLILREEDMLAVVE